MRAREHRWLQRLRKRARTGVLALLPFVVASLFGAAVACPATATSPADAQPPEHVGHAHAHAAEPREDAREQGVPEVPPLPTSCPHCLPAGLAGTHALTEHEACAAADGGNDAAPYPGWTKWDAKHALGPAADAPHPAAQAPPRGRSPVRARPPPFPVPLNLRYCVFLI